MKNNFIFLIFMTSGILGGAAIGHVWGWMGIAVSDYKDLSRTPAWTRSHK